MEQHHDGRSLENPVPVVAHLSAPIEPYDRGDEINSALRVVEHHTMVTRHRLAATYQIAAFADTSGLPGAFVECGTWKGGSSGIMALAHLRHGTQARVFHLFDSFTDMCVPDESIDGDLAIAQARATPGVTGPLDGSLRPMEGFYTPLGGHATPQDVRSLLIDTIGIDKRSVVIHEGWFQDTVPTARGDIGAIAVLRLDTDFYSGTRFCLEQLFDQVVVGGFVIFDDYGCYEGCRRAVDEFLARTSPPMFLNHIDAEGRYIIKR